MNGEPLNETDHTLGDGPCQDCDRIYPAWFAPHEVWNLVVGGPEATDDPGGLLCPTCFLIRADGALSVPAWQITTPREVERIIAGRLAPLLMLADEVEAIGDDVVPLDEFDKALGMTCSSAPSKDGEH